jgi:hypothetical protein
MAVGKKAVDIRNKSFSKRNDLLKTPLENLIMLKEQLKVICTKKRQKEKRQKCFS